VRLWVYDRACGLGVGFRASNTEGGHGCPGGAGLAAFPHEAFIRVGWACHDGRPCFSPRFAASAEPGRAKRDLRGCGKNSAGLSQGWR